MVIAEPKGRPKLNRPPEIEDHPPTELAAAQRNQGIDHIRVGLTALVIFHHTAIVYGGSGGWFWRAEPDGSNPLLVVFNAVNQAYFMGFFFLLAGYFTPQAYEKKGSGRFLQDRLVRLGIPLAVFFLLLHPLTVAIVRTRDGHPLLEGWWQMIVARDFGPGPLWFAEALLIFALAYVGWREALKRSARPAFSLAALPGNAILAIAAVMIGIVSFLIRLVVPIGHEVAGLQLGYFAPYVFLFAAGCAASRSGLLESIDIRQARLWMRVSVVSGLLLLVLFVTRGDAGGFEGGWTLNAFLYALWDPVFAWGVILGLLWGAPRWWPRQTPLGAWLGRGAFGAYIVHPPILVAISLALAASGLPPLLKFAAVGLAATVASFSVSAILRAIPGVRSVI